MGANPIRIPQRTEALVPFIEEIIEECYASLERRREQYRYFRSFYYTGSDDSAGTKHNKCFSHVDKLSSLLFSASDLSFDITFDGAEVGEFAEMGDTSARYLTREYIRSRSGLVFGQGVDVALVDGCSFIKKVWTHSGVKSHIIRPQFMGVLREDLNDLDEQDAFVNSFYVTPTGLKRLISGRPDRKAILERAMATMTTPGSADTDGDYFHEIVLGGLQPVTTSGTPSGQRGSVSPYATPSPMLSPEVAASLIRVDDVWIMDDEREDWTTIRYIKPGIILEGDLIHRNLSDIPKEQPFLQICPNETPGYFWGASELSTVTGLQKLITTRMNDADSIIKRQANPSRAFIGFNNITPERAAALMSLNGMLSDDSPNGKIETLAPTMPPDLLKWMEYLNQCFDDQAGITDIMQGKGESGVRSGNHAGALLRTSTPRLRDRALLVEDSVATDGQLTLKMLQTKVAKVFTTTDNRQFILQQLPDDATVTVDSHSSSPAFSGDQMQVAFNLLKLGAIDKADAIEMMPGLPRKAELKIKAQARAKQEADFIEKHPELLKKGGHR